MPVTRLLSRTAALAGAATLLATVGVATGEQRTTTRDSKSDTAPYVRSGVGQPLSSQLARSTFSAEPATVDQQNLPARREHVDLVSRLTFTGGPGGSIAAGQIADVAVHRDAAYLMSWSEPENCDRGGFFSVDISNPAAPRELAFVPALPGSYHGEGAHAVTFNTTAFQGDVLAVNNEPCPNVAEAPGGFSLFDVSDPANPQPLVQGYGDTGEEGLVGDYEFSNSAHSSFVWQNDGRAFIVIVDNFEATDVDIFEVTDPRNPQPIGEFDFVEVAEDQGIELEGEEALGATPFLHDMVVKEINGRQVMLASYWDAGYLQVDVEDPANPRILADNDFGGADPETGAVSREGNAHQAEYSADNRYFLAADEDFAPYRPEEFQITTGPNAGDYAAAEVGGGTSVAALPDEKLNGPTVYGGYGCPDPDGAGPLAGSDPIPPRDEAGLPPLGPGEEAIVVLQRGPGTFDPDGPTGPEEPRPSDPENPEESCFPGEKAAMGQAAGYDAVVIVNRHFGSANDDEAYCGSGGYPRGVSVVTLCTTHTAFHRMFNSEPNYEEPYRDEAEPDRGTVGEKLLGTASFDGWGYAHLYEATAGKMREVDTYSVQESRDPRFAFGFGDLSIHEWATDPTEPLAYAAYYGAGFRVVSFGEDGIQEQGVFIDDRGNNFWGVEQFTDAAGNRLVALADRDYGLYIVKYTGPGAVLAKPPAQPPAGDGTVPPPNPGDPNPPGQIGPRGLSHFRVGAQTLRTAKRRGVGVTVRCPSGNCPLHLTLRVDRPTRRKLGLNTRTIGRRKVSLRRGEQTVRVRFSKAARRALRKQSQVRVIVVAVVPGAVEGSRFVASARLTRPR